MPVPKQKYKKQGNLPAFDEKIKKSLNFRL